MPYAYNPVGPAMSRVADRLFQTGQQMGQSRRMDSELAMKRAAFDKGVADEKRYVTPVKERELQMFNEQVEAEDRPLNLYRDFYGGGTNPQGGVNRPDGIIFAFRDQKAGPGSMHADFVNTLGDRYGLKIDEQSGAITDENGQPIPKRALQTKYPHLVNEFRRASGIYRDPEYDLEDRRQRIAHGVETGEIEDPKAVEWLKKTEKLPMPQKVALNDRYLQNLYATKAYDQREGRDTTYIDYQISRIENRINGYKGQMSEAEKRKYERWKELDKRRYEQGEAATEHDRAKELERLKQSGKSPNASLKKQEDEYAVRRAVGQMQLAGIPVDFDVERGLVVPSNLTGQQFQEAQRIAGENGMSISAAPFESEENVPGSGILGTSWFGKPATGYQVRDIVPVGGRQPIMGRAPAGAQAGGKGQPGPETASPAESATPEGLPPTAKQGPDGEWYVPLQNGGWAKAVQEEQTPTGQTAQQALRETEQSPGLGNRSLPPENEALVRKGMPKAAPPMQRQPNRDKYEGIPETRADLRFAADVKETAQQVDGALSKIRLGWENWKAAFNSPMMRGKAHLDDAYNLYLQFVSKAVEELGEAFSWEDITTNEGAQKRLREIADDTAKGE